MRKWTLLASAAATASVHERPRRRPLPSTRGFLGGYFKRLRADAFWFELGSAERHRSRTCLASGYDAVLVLKITNFWLSHAV
jgi:hypothetical protein